MIVRGQGGDLSDVSGAVQVRIAMGHTGYCLRPGHRLRLNIASRDFPEYMRHPGTDENPWLATETKPSYQQLITRADAPASLRLKLCWPAGEPNQVRRRVNIRRDAIVARPIFGVNRSRREAGNG